MNHYIGKSFGNFLANENLEVGMLFILRGVTYEDDDDEESESYEGSLLIGDCTIDHEPLGNDGGQGYDWEGFYGSSIITDIRNLL